MTTVVVTKKNGVVCIAADTLATYGDLRETADLIANSDKLVRVGDAWLAPTGPASAQLVLKHFVNGYEELPVLEDTDGIFDFLTHLQRSLRDEYFVQGKEDSQDDFESMRMELLIASPGGIFGAYPQRSVQEYTRFYAFGSGAEYAMGAMQAAWDRCETAEDVARIGVETAAKFDAFSGLPITLRTMPLRDLESGPPPLPKVDLGVVQPNGIDRGTPNGAGSNGTGSNGTGSNGAPTTNGVHGAGAGRLESHPGD